MLLKLWCKGKNFYDKGQGINAEPLTTEDPIVGTYYCYRTQDTYVFQSGKIGYFTVQGGSPSVFTWKRSGKNVTIVYEVFGKQKLKFDSQAQTLTEESKSLGTLVFDKQ